MTRNISLISQLREISIQPLDKCRLIRDSFLTGNFTHKDGNVVVVSSQTLIDCLVQPDPIVSKEALYALRQLLLFMGEFSICRFKLILVLFF